MRSSKENLKSTSLTKKKNTLLNVCLASEGSLPSLRRGPQTWVSTLATLWVYREAVPVMSPRPPPPPPAWVLLLVPLSIRSYVSAPLKGRVIDLLLRVIKLIILFPFRKRFTVNIWQFTISNNNHITLALSLLGKYVDWSEKHLELSSLNWCCWGDNV